jgi:hypothetical protein
MSERIITELKNIKQNDKNLHQHLKHLISSLVTDKASVDNFEAYSSHNRIHGPPA